MNSGSSIPQILTVQIDYFGVWYTTVFAGMAITTVTFLASSWARKRIPLSVRCLWGYVFLYALFYAVCPVVPFGAITRSFQVTAAQVALELILLPIAAVLFFRSMRPILIFTAIASCLCVWFPYPGLMIAPSFNTALAALAVPFIPWWAAVFVIATAIAHHGATALLILAAEFLGDVIYRRRLYWQLIPVLLVGGALTYAHHTGKWLDGYDRIEHWKVFFAWWAQSWHWIVLGVGPGTFIWISIIMGKFTTPLFLQMHSDWLQVLWEEGLVGFSLSIWVWMDAVRRARQQRVENLAGVFGVAAFCLTYHPFRFFPSALLATWIFVTVFSYKTGSLQDFPSCCSFPAPLLRFWIRIRR
jgi:hypothetical protein